MKKLLGIAALAALVSAPATLFAAAAGSYEGKAVAIKVGGSKSVSLVGEYDPDWKETSDFGVCYLSVTLTKGAAYTVWIEGGKAADIGLEVYARDATDKEMDKDVYGPMAGFMTEDYGSIKAAYLEADDWDGDDPKSWLYYIVLDGDIGASTTVHVSQGIQGLVQQGTEENPLALKLSKTPVTTTKSFVDGEYYLRATLEAGRKYQFRTSGGTAESPFGLSVDGPDADVDVTEEANPTATVSVNETGAYTIVVAGDAATFTLVSQEVEGDPYELTVNIKGASGTWSVSDGVKRAGGETVVVYGPQTVKFQAVKGFSTPAAQQVLPPKDGAEAKVTVLGVYSDTFDTKDDTSAGATKLSPAAKEATAARTLFAEDPADWFSFSAKAGTYYNFTLRDVAGDAVLALYRKGKETEPVAGPAASLQAVAPGAGDFLVKAFHANATPADASFTLAYSSAAVGAIQFKKASVSAKKSAGSVTLQVARTAKEGKVRVKYGTVAGTAKPGVDYVAQNGELVWEAGDGAAKAVTIRLIPEAGTAAVSRQFAVRLEPLAEAEVGPGEYVASVATPSAAVTVTEAAARAPKAPTAATVKTESVPLETGTFTGVLGEDGSALTNGLPALASVVFTAKSAAKKALSAKVTVAGKTYAFAADGWSGASDAEVAVAEMTQAQKIGSATYENTLVVTVRRGQTAAGGAFLASGATAVLTMAVPDANGKGAQEAIAYAGALYRDNAKIQEYLTAVLGAAGYYTAALVPCGAPDVRDAPAGNGYLTLTIDSKGKAKVAGLLADGATKLSATSFAAVCADGTVRVPVFLSKSPCCFGGTLVLKPGAGGRYVVDSASTLVWNNDNAALTWWGEEGWRLEVEPVGGYFDTVANLQAAYLTCATSVSTVDVSDLPAEALAAGYAYAGDAQPSGTEVLLTGNAFSTAKRDLSAGVNPCNVQVKLARATGLVTGSFGVWTTNGSSRKEISGLKHQGVLILSRDEAASLDPEVLTAGFFTQKVQLVSGGKKRAWTASLPFNVLAVDLGEPDWYADDWGERPEE